MTEEDGSNAPWWASAQKLIWTLGPVTVAFFLYLFVGLGWLSSPMLENITTGTTIMGQNQKIMRDIQVGVQLHQAQMQDGQTMLARSLRQICRNTAKTPVQNEKCDDMNP